MSHCVVEFAGETLQLHASGVLVWPARKTLVVSDLHLGKSERIARRGGTILPPYDTQDTLSRLAEAIALHAPKRVICLGDSFDDVAAAHALAPEAYTQISTLQAGREWIWIEGNHDAGPIDIGGTHLATLPDNDLVFRHIAEPDLGGCIGEISGHFHPKARVSLRGRSIARPCFAFDTRRIILPAFGAYTGGLWTHDPAISTLMGPKAQVALLGAKIARFPMPRAGGGMR